MRVKNWMAIALIGLAASASQAVAAPLPPGADLSPPPTIALPSGVFKVAETTEVLDIGTGTERIRAGLSSTVFKQAATGFLTFTYQISAYTGSADILSVAIGNFFGITIPDAGVLSPGAKVVPDTLARTADGSTISFSFLTGLVAGATSAQVTIVTEATEYASVKATVTNENGASVEYSTFAATPEPATLALAFTALPILGLRRLARRRARS